MNDLKKEFGAHLRLLRIQRQITQEQLSAAANLSVDFLSLIERGKNSPSFASLEKLAQALKVPVQELFNFHEQ